MLEWGCPLVAILRPAHKPTSTPRYTSSAVHHPSRSLTSAPLPSGTTGRMWRKTMQPNDGAPDCPGTDLNRNWGSQWGGADLPLPLPNCASTDPCSNSFQGPSVWSEPESAHVRDFLAEDGPARSENEVSGWDPALPHTEKRPCTGEAICQHKSSSRIVLPIQACTARTRSRDEQIVPSPVQGGCRQHRIPYTVPSRACQHV